MIIRLTDMQEKSQVKSQSRSEAEERYKLAKMRGSIARAQTKYSAGGREKRRTRQVMPRLKCLESDPQ